MRRSTRPRARPARRLLLSFWDLGLENLPVGRFERKRVSPARARQLITNARARDRLRCASAHDLLAPYGADDRRQCQRLCQVLRRHFEIAIELKDFLSADSEDGAAVQFTTPLNCLQLAVGDQLLIVTCNFKMTSRSRANHPLHRLVLAPDSVEFHLITALGSAG